MESLCRLFGKSRQGYYKQRDQLEDSMMKEEVVLAAADKIRRKASTKRWGGRKLQRLINEQLQSMKIHVGRDWLFDLLRTHHQLVPTRKRRYYTTQSHHWLRKYDNLTTDMELTAPGQLWVADITYIKGVQDVHYLHLITDAWSKKIVGWHLSEDLRASSSLFALNMALQCNRAHLVNLIHHSDRGVQYCSEEYVSQLQKHQISISMTNPSSPQQNAIAERVNGILKEEWIEDYPIESITEGRKLLKKFISIYNNYRPHLSLGMLTPQKVHDKGFLRHETVRVIGKTYQYKRKVAKVDNLPPCDNANGQETIPRAVAPQQSCTPLHPCKANVKNEANQTNKTC